MVISPHYKSTDFPTGTDGELILTLENKIDIFYDRVHYWQLDVADLLINGGKDRVAKDISPIDGSGFAVLSIAFSYFEMIAQYQEGFMPKSKRELFGHSKRHFTEGFYSVFSEWNAVRQEYHLDDVLIPMLLAGVRNRLYHDGFTASNVILTGDLPDPIAITIPKSPGFAGLIINPHKIPARLKIHLQQYVDHLRDSDNVEYNGLRTNFEARFDFSIWQIEKRAVIEAATAP